MFINWQVWHIFVRVKVAMTFAEAILRTRKQLNMTQLEFAKASGMSLRALCRLEAGEEPRPNALIALADVSKDREGLGYYHALFDAAEPRRRDKLDDKGGEPRRHRHLYRLRAGDQ